MKRSFLILISIIAFANLTFSQYYFFPKEKNHVLKVYGFNLQTRKTKCVYSDDVNPYGNILWDPTQQWVFIERDNSYLCRSMGEYDYCVTIDAVNINKLTLKHKYPDQHSHPPNTFPHSFSQGLGSRGFVMDGIVYNPNKKLFYVTWFLPTPGMSGTIYSSYQRTAIYDATTFRFLDTLSVPPGWITGVSSVSDDGNYLYVEKFEHTEKTDSIGIYSLSMKQLIINRGLSDIIVKGGYKDVDDSKKGRYLIQYLYPSLNLSDKKYAVYDIDRDTTYFIIPFPLVANGFISSDGKYVIIEETPFNPNYTTLDNRVFHPGRISVFDGQTGKLIQKLKLPPDGKTLVFDNYPNTIYYYLPKEQRSINIDLSELMKNENSETTFK
jgi:hypothetical protein